MLASILLLAITVSFTGLAAAEDEGSREEVRGSPSFELAAQENRVLPGETRSLRISVSNGGELWSAGPSDMEERVKTARNTRVSVQERSLHEDIELYSGPVLMGTVPPGLAEPVSFELEFSDDIEPGRYSIPLEIRYDWTRRITRTSGGRESYHEFSTTERTSVTVVVRDGARFQETSTDIEVAPGERATAEVTLENTGNQDARDAVATVTGGSAVSFEDGASSTEVSLGDVRQGGTVTASLPVHVHEDAEAQRFSLEIDVSYRTQTGLRRSGGTTRTSFASASKPSVSLTTTESGLRSGGFGTVTLEVANDGDRELRDLALHYAADDQVEVRDPRLGVGDLDSGETEEVGFRAEVPGGVTTPRTLEFTPTYTADGRRFTATTASARADVGEYTPELRITADENTVEIGSTTTVSFEVENQLRETTADLTATLEAQDPLEVEFQEAYLGDVEPGETTTLTYDVEVERDATQRSYPVHVEFEFTDEAGEVRTTRRQSVGVEATDDDTPLPIGVEALVFTLLAALVAVAFLWLYRR